VKVTKSDTADDRPSVSQFRRDDHVREDSDNVAGITNRLFKLNKLVSNGKITPRI